MHFPHVLDSLGRIHLAPLHLEGENCVLHEFSRQSGAIPRAHKVFLLQPWVHRQQVKIINCHPRQFGGAAPAQPRVYFINTCKGTGRMTMIERPRLIREMRHALVQWHGAHGRHGVWPQGRESASKWQGRVGQTS
jgi:hypothetical protein